MAGRPAQNIAEAKEGTTQDMKRRTASYQEWSRNWDNVLLCLCIPLGYAGYVYCCQDSKHSAAMTWVRIGYYRVRDAKLHDVGKAYREALCRT